MSHPPAAPAFGGAAPQAPPPTTHRSSGSAAPPGYARFPQYASAAPQQQQQQQPAGAYPAPPYPAYGAGAHPPQAPGAAAASSAQAGAYSPSATSQSPAQAYPSYPSYPAYGGAYAAQASQAPPPQEQQQQPPQQQHVYIPHESTREEVVDAAIAATSQHWVQTQVKRETERRYEQMYGVAPPTAAARARANGGGGGDGDDGYARENAVRHAPGAGPSLAASAGVGGGAMSQRPHVEFLIGSPRHVCRLALLFLATLFGILPLMSAFAFTTLLCGVVLLYISDYLGYHRTTVLVLLGTAAVFAAALLFTNIHAAATSFGPMLMIADLGGLLMIVVAAAVQHFRWVQETYPNVLCALERLVFAVGPILCLPPLLTTTTALVGSRYAPFFFFAVMCTLHQFFYCPLKSSFLVLVSTKSTAPAAPTSGPPADAPASAGVHARRRNAGAADAEEERVAGPAGDADDDAASVESSSSAHGAPLQLNEQVEALLFSCLLIILPVAVYNAIQSNWGDHVVANMLNSIGLVCGSLAYFCVSPAHSLWFLASPPEETYTLSQQLEYDPLGLMDLVSAVRLPLLSVAAVVGVHWGAYRLLGSRYAYLFSGLPFPYNAILLLIAFYIAVYVAIEIKRLLDVDARGGDVTKGKYLLQRTPILVGSCVVAIILCILTSAPGVFYFPAVLSITSFNLFLMDRTNGGPMFSFTVFTCLMLLWWMYRTYSFIVMDLRVFGETATVPTPVLGVSVMWCYVLGCMSFTLSFSSNKVPLTSVMFLLALQVTFVEHVLYSQKEESAYPAVLVALTSAVGVAVACRMYANGVFSVYSAAFIASCYVAKFFTFLVEVTSAYYAAELSMHDRLSPFRAGLLVMEMTGGWWVALYAGYLVATFEIERRRRLKMEAAKRMLVLYAGMAALLSLLTVRNVQRAAYELVTQSYVAEQELPHIAAGTFCATFALLTLPVWWRLQGRYPAVFPLRAISRGMALLAVVLLAVQPTRVLEDDVSPFDYDFEYADSGRYAAVVGIFMLLGARVPFLQRVPFVGRFAYWLVTAASLALGITGLVQAAPTFGFFVMMLGLVFLILLMLDAAHYRDVNSTVLMVVYGLSIIMIPLSFLQFNRAVTAQQNQVRHSQVRMAVLWDAYEQGSMRLLAVVVVVHLGLAVMLNCRLSGRPLLPRCKEIPRDAAQSLGVIANFSVELTVALLCAINFYGNDSEPALYVLSSLLLLLFVNDEVIFFGLKEDSFRYFPPTACALTLLWLCMLWNGWRTGAPHGYAAQLGRITHTMIQATLTLPAQLSLLVLLWRGRKGGSSPGVLVIGSIVLNLICLLFVSDKAVQWMAIVGVFGQCARVFDVQLQPTTGSRRRRTGAY